MLSSVQSFFSRHKYKIIFGGMAIGGVVLISDYLKKLKKNVQEQEFMEVFERSRKEMHYKVTEDVYNKTVGTSVKSINSKISELLNNKQILEQLRNRSSKKVRLWEKLMVISFTKVVVTVYTCTLVMILLKIQLNLIGGCIYRDSADGTKKLDSTSQGEYLSIYTRIIEFRIQDLIALIQQKVKVVLKKHSLRDNMSITDIEKILWAIQTAVGEDPKDPCKTIADYCIPMSMQSPNHKSGMLDKIMIETRDILELEEIQSVAQSSLVSGFSCAMDMMTEYYIGKHEPTQAKANSSKLDVGYWPAHYKVDTTPDDYLNLTRKTLPMAKVIPILDSFVPGKKDFCLAENFMNTMFMMNSLKVLGANIYESYSCNF